MKILMLVSICLAFPMMGCEKEAEKPAQRQAAKDGDAAKNSDEADAEFEWNGLSHKGNTKYSVTPVP